MAPMALPSLGVSAMLLVTLLTVPLLYSLAEELRFRRRDSEAIPMLYGIMNLRAAPADPGRHSADQGANQPYFWSGFGLGMALILLNPSTLLAWLVFFGSWMADVDKTSGIAAAVGIGCGSFAWFAFVAFLAHRGKQFLQKKSLTINRAVGLFLIGFGIYSIGKAAHYWIYVA